MPLTRDQLLLAAGSVLAVALAFDEPGTISSMEHGGGAHGAEHGVEAIGHGAEHIEHGKLIQLHVKTPQGERFYHLPIGSLIIKHPGHLPEGHGGHSKLVSAGEHHFLVPKDAEVHVPKDTDLSDEKAVKDAAKHIVLHSSLGEERHAHISEKGSLYSPALPKPSIHDLEETHAQLKEHWKKLPDQEGKKSVAFGGKHAAWVPHDWKVYKAPVSESELGAKWAQDPQGKWHSIYMSGKITSLDDLAEAKKVTADPDKWLKEGKLLPDKAVHAPVQKAVEPLKPGAAKVEVGGVPVTHDEIHKAMEILHADKSTAVKQPLKAKGHPLAAMDYHGVAKDELKAHPELKVEKGSKQAHVGQVKIAVLHHLAEQAKNFPQDEAQEEAGETVQEEVKEQAAHAQALTPAVHELGGVAASKEDIEAAIQHLSATKATAIKQTLAAKGNPLAKTDYWAVVKAHQAQFPNATKDMKAKPVFIAALQHHLDQLAKEDKETGHDDAAALHELISTGGLKGIHPYEDIAGKKIAEALVKAHHYGNPQYVYPVQVDGEKKWVTSSFKPVSWKADMFYKATPEHKVTYSFTGQPEQGFSPEHVASIASNNIVAKGVQEAAQPAPKTEPVKAVVKAQEDYTKQPGWDVLHSLVKNAEPPTYGGMTTDSDHVFGVALHMSHDDGKSWYVTKVGDKYKLDLTEPVTGSFGSPAGHPYWEVTPQHEIVGTTVYGSKVPMPVGAATVFAQKLEPKEAASEGIEGQLSPKEAEKEVPVYYDGKQVASLPAGTTLYQKKSSAMLGVQYGRTEDGQWFRITKDGGVDKFNSNFSILEAQLKNGKLEPTKQLPPAGTAEKAEEKPDEVFVKGEVVGHVPAGSVQYTGKAATDPVNGVKFVKKPDGTWDTYGTFGDNGPATPEFGQSLNELLANGQFQEVHGKPDVPAGDKIPISVSGTVLGHAPAGSQVFYSPHTGPSAIKYVKNPDGSWTIWDKSGVSEDFDFSTYEKNGSLIPLPHAVSAPETKESEVAEPEAKEPGATIQVMVKGKESGQVPAGSKIYYDFSSGPPDQAANKYVKDPDGKWSMWGTSGEVGSYASKDWYQKQNDKMEASGQLVAEGQETPDQLKMQKLIPDLKNGVLDPAKQDSASFDQALVKTAQAAVEGKAAPVFSQDSYGKWETSDYSNWLHGSQKLDYYQVKNTNGMLSLQHVVSGEEKEEPLQKLFDASGEHIVPNSVIVGNSLYKHGFYYKPKGKAYLEVKKPTGYSSYSSTYKYGQAAKAQYMWHGKDGEVTELTPNAAAKHLETATHFPEPKPVEEEVPGKGTVSYAEISKPGTTYKLWSGVEHGPSTTTAWETKGDGSALLHGPGGYTLLAAGEKGLPEDQMLAGGGLLDTYGTTVVKPGVPPSKYHLFGSEALEPHQVQELLDDLEKAYGHNNLVMQALKDHIPGFDAPALPGQGLNQVRSGMQGFWNDKLTGNVAKAQTDSIMGLLRELLAVPKAEPGSVTEAKAQGVSYLKGLPSGISSSKDVFPWTDQGLAKLLPSAVGTHLGGGQMQTHDYLSSPELSAKIKNISSDYGSGKVVGTHVSSLTKNQKSQWLHAWETGNMQKVFSLDSSGGKVSPAHPGAPENEATHTIKWSPYDPSQVPAGTEIPGNWSDPGKVTLPMAEVHNYLIKAGLQHAEYLTPQEKRSWVSAHRASTQNSVDALTKLAQDRFGSGIAPHSEVPTWTDNLKPANSYDVLLENKTSASSWPYQAMEDFAKDHWDKLEPLATKAGYTQQYLSESTYARRQVIQDYLDKLKADEIAEKSKPVWGLTVGAKTPASTNPLLSLTRTIPLTGDKSEWFYKPVAKPFRAEVEHAANELGRLWGYKTPQSQLLDYEGKFGQAQRKLAAVGDMTYGQSLGYYDRPKMDWSSLTQREVSDISREHVLDWALANDDGRASNFLRMPDGSIVGIDKGRAWRNFTGSLVDDWTKGDWNGLSGDHQADSNCALMVTGLYNAIRDHSISKDVADKAYIDTVQRAQKMERLPDQRMHDVMAEGIKNRPGLHSDAEREAFIQHALNRKNSLSADFKDLWGRVYKDAGWTLPEVPDSKLSAGADGIPLHSGFSDPDFMDHVTASKSYGTPAFFGGTELEDGHFLVWHEYAGKGNDSPVVRGESAARGAAFKKLTDWAAAHQTGGPTNTTPEVKSPDVGKVPDEKEFYDKIIAGAKTVSHHVTDKQFNQGKMDALAAAKKSLTGRLAAADSVKDAEPGSPELNSWKDMNLGDPKLVSSMASYYLDHIAKIEEAKDTGHKFKAGELPRWEVPENLISKPEEAVPDEEKPLPPPVKVELTNISRALSVKGSEDTFDENGELHTGSAGSISHYPGQGWRITLPTGEEIEFHNGGKHGVARAHQGRIRFKANAEEGTASLERVRSQLQDMGLDMREADDHDLQLFYWRHLAGILGGRDDASSGKHGQVWQELSDQAKAHGIGHAATGIGTGDSAVDKIAGASLDPETELGMWHAAWGKLTSPEQVQDWADKGGWLPHQDHFDLRNPEAVQGKPYWMRFDVDPEKIPDMTMPAMASSHPDVVAQRMVNGGGRFSTEARMRALGSGVTGMSSSEDMQKGSSGTIFTRLNQENHSGTHVLLSPHLLARTSTYSFNSDHYGDTADRSSASPFRMSTALGFSNSSNETMIKDAASLLDGVELVEAPSGKRAALISQLHGLGITHIRGLPVEERIVPSINSENVEAARHAMRTDSAHVGWWPK